MSEVATIVLFGPWGAGKSCLSNVLIGQNPDFGHFSPPFYSLTDSKSFEVVEVGAGGARWRVGDTPGFGGREVSFPQLEQEYVNIFQGMKTYKKIHCCLVVVNVQDIRHAISLKKTIQYLKTYFEEALLGDFMKIVVTNWNSGTLTNSHIRQGKAVFAGKLRETLRTAGFTAPDQLEVLFIDSRCAAMSSMEEEEKVLYNKEDMDNFFNTMSSIIKFATANAEKKVGLTTSELTYKVPSPELEEMLSANKQKSAPLLKEFKEFNPEKGRVDVLPEHAVFLLTQRRDHLVTQYRTIRLSTFDDYTDYTDFLEDINREYEERRLSFLPEDHMERVRSYKCSIKRCPNPDCGLYLEDKGGCYQRRCGFDGHQIDGFEWDGAEFNTEKRPHKLGCTMKFRWDDAIRLSDDEIRRLYQIDDLEKFWESQRIVSVEEAKKEHQQRGSINERIKAANQANKFAEVKGIGGHDQQWMKSLKDAFTVVRSTKQQVQNSTSQFVESNPIIQSVVGSAKQILEKTWSFFHNPAGHHTK
eukprot:TRINITY_DN1883_c0_g1_i2.p1 TRINITY_DN1883_c0_g1~~TRINITY_DN1883_c0_g1_i2.p1  ORF type:complete len:556 (-),score=154.42 TRINITY_DN1883_c0_g1_i2:73-1653(-)